MKIVEVKIEDVKKYVELAVKKSWEKFQEKQKNNEKDWNHWKGRCDSYQDLLYMILGRDEERYHLRLDKNES